MARQRASAAGLAALPELAEQLGIDADRVERVRAEMTEHAQRASDDDGLATPSRDPERELRLAVLATKRRVVIELRDANEIDDIVLREVQASLDLEEVRLLGPAPSD